jgi:hypothetical protein
MSFLIFDLAEQKPVSSRSLLRKQSHIALK